MAKKIKSRENTMADNINEAPDLDVLDAKNELEKRIHSALVRAPKLVRHRLQSSSLWDIAGCMKVTKNTYDFGRLPIYYKKPRAPRPKKYDCLRALVTFIVVKWWDYSLDRIKTPFPMAFLEQLELILELGLDKFKITGAYAGGFRLVLCKKCNDTGLVNQVGEDEDTDYCTCPAGIARNEKDDECIEDEEDE